MSTQNTGFWCFFHTFCLYQARRGASKLITSESYPDLCVLCSQDPQTWRIPSVFCSNYVLPISILNSWWSVNWSHIKCDKWINFWLNISPRSFTDRYSFCRWASKSTSSWFCFSLWSARKSKYIRFQRKCFRLHLTDFLLVVVVVLLVAQVRNQLIQSMRHSDPRVRIVFVHRFNSDFPSMFT